RRPPATGGSTLAGAMSPLLNEWAGGGIEIEAFDVVARRQQAYVLADGAAAHVFAQVVGDALAAGIEAERPALVPRVDQHDVKTVAGLHRVLRHRADRQARERLLELRRGLPAPDDAQVPAGLARGAVRVLADQRG